LGTTRRGGRESIEIGTGQQTFKAFANRAARHRLEPEPVNRLVRVQGVDDFAEDQLSLATRIAGVDDTVGIVALQEFSDRPDPVALALLRLQLEFVG
jgi:hypothetical protein